MSQLVNAKEAQWDEEIFIAFSPHESKPRCIFESFCAKTEINHNEKAMAFNCYI